MASTRRDLPAPVSPVRILRWGAQVSEMSRRAGGSGCVSGVACVEFGANFVRLQVMRALGVLLALGVAWAQVHPLWRTYTDEDYGPYGSVWGMAQDPVTGILYGATNAGVIEYDGQRWNLISTPAPCDRFGLAPITEFG
jgi:hypothetical protein